MSGAANPAPVLLDVNEAAARGDVDSVDGVSLRVGEGEIVALTGPGRSRHVGAVPGDQRSRRRSPSWIR